MIPMPTHSYEINVEVEHNLVHAFNLMVSWPIFNGINNLEEFHGALPGSTIFILTLHEMFNHDVHNRFFFNIKTERLQRYNARIKRVQKCNGKIEEKCFAVFTQATVFLQF